MFAVEGVAPGWAVYSTTRRYAGGAEYAVGGVVIEVLPGYTDADTGEIRPPRFKCVDRYRPEHPWQYLDAPEVDTSLLNGVDRLAATGAALYLLRQIPAKRRLFRPDDVALIHDAWILAKAAARL